jgi:hypothetical protein
VIRVPVIRVHGGRCVGRPTGNAKRPLAAEAASGRRIH